MTPVLFSSNLCNWHKALKIFPFLIQIFNYFAWNCTKQVEIDYWRWDINQKQGKYPWITGTLTDYHYFSPTEFLSCFFSKLNLFRPPRGGAFGQNIYPWHIWQIKFANARWLNLLNNGSIKTILSELYKCLHVEMLVGTEFCKFRN